MIRLLLLLAVCFVTGCATNALTPKAVSKEDLNENNGILIGSFSRDPSAPKYYSQTFRFKNVVSGEIHNITSQPTFNMFSGKTPDDFQTPDSNGGIFIFSLPAGKYTFYNFRLYQSNGYVNENWSSREAYSIPFEVNANAVNYIGEIKLLPDVGKNFFGVSVNTGGSWVISDQTERDTKFILLKHPFISMDKAINIIPTEKEIFTPFVILPSELEMHNKSSNTDAESAGS